MIQLPLLWVCHNFCAFVYGELCKRYCLEVFSNEEKPYGSPDFWPYRHRNPDNPSHQTAKELTLKFDAWAVYSGKALEHLSTARFEGCPFPHVRVLLVTLHINPKEAGDGDEFIPAITKDYPLEMTANTTAFVQRLKQMAPGINEVDVEVLLDIDDGISLEECSVHDRELARQLFGIADTMVAITPGSAPMVMFMDLEPLRSLVRIDIQLDGYAEVIVPMVRRNTQTLQVLAVSVRGLAEITGLIQNTGVGDYLEYPCLHTLKLYEFNGLMELKKPVFPGAVPFPNLRKLTLWSCYPFGDDVVFRGNAATLMYLDMEMDITLITVILKHDVFTPGSHPKLHCVIVDSLERHTLIEHPNYPAYLQFVLGIGQGAPVREYGIPKFGNYLLLETPLHSRLANIQVLTLSHTPVDLWGILALLKLLPVLSDLTTLPPALGPMPTGVTRAKLTAHVISNYSPTAKRFHCWRFCDHNYGDHTDIVMCVVLVALVCPNFDYAAPRPSGHKIYREKLEDTIATGGFKKYAPRLRRLLFDRGQN
ncbi:hypothetical protein GGI08_000487 [Coemansia sp. S2]|nr:hypothetical protein GGI08_000487 [Coemansia sp. S2]